MKIHLSACLTVVMDMSAPKVGGTLRGGLLLDRAADIMRHAARSTVEHSWMTKMANAQSSLDALRELIPLYFYRLNSTSAIATFLLLNSFAQQREAEELREGRQELEDHIAKLKSRVVELEERDNGAVTNGEQKKAHILSAENARLRLAQAEVRSHAANNSVHSILAVALRIYHGNCVTFNCSFVESMSNGRSTTKRLRSRD